MTDSTSIDEINDFFDKAFEKYDVSVPQLTRVESDEFWISYTPAKFDIRPGGFISGPTQMRLADQCGYVGVFLKVGVTPMAMTSNLNIDFLRPAAGDTLTAHCKILKMGRKLGVFSVSQYTTNPDKPVSFATVTYVLPDS